jgi:hypothetical protein
MFGSLVFGLYALAFSILASLYRSKFSLLLGFFVVFVFLALRYDYGTDLPTYRLLFETLRNNTLAEIIAQRDGQFEIGYKLLNKLFAPFGFNSLLAFCAALQLAAFYKIIKRAVPAGLEFFALFILLINPNLLLTESSSVRQTLAMSLFLLAIDSLFERKFTAYLLICLGASLFHYSALVLIPFYFILTPNRLNRFNGFALLIVFLLFVFAGRILITKPLELILTAAGSKYLGFLNSALFGVFEIGSGIKILVHASVMLMIIFRGNELTGFQAIAMKGALFSSVMLSLGFGFPMAGRLSMYFDPLVAVAFPCVIDRMKKDGVAYIAMLLYAIFIVALYYQFFSAPGWTQSFSRYTTIFSQGR